LYVGGRGDANAGAAAVAACTAHRARLKKALRERCSSSSCCGSSSAHRRLNRGHSSRE